MADIMGGNGPDTLTGTAGDDWIYGAGGSDLISGLGGDDDLEGGAGNDRVHGLAGADNLDGGDGNDLLAGGAGDDVIYGEFGDDRLTGGAGNDWIDGDDGNDVLAGGSGVDHLSGDWGDDTLIGGSNYTMMEGGDGDDVLDGRPQPGSGGFDTDVADYSGSTHGVAVDLRAGTAADGEGGTDRLYDIESVIGSSHDDRLLGGDKGNDGQEVFDGRDGNDVINGRSGVDIASYTLAPSGMNSGIAANLEKGLIHDQWGCIDRVKNVEGVYATNLEDVLVGSGADNRFQPGLGRDFISGRGGHDQLLYQSVGYSSGKGIDADLQAGLVLKGQADIDHIRSIEDIQGTDYSDTLRGNAAGNLLMGLAGDDLLTGRGGGDWLSGDRGNDYLNGGEGNDLLNGGEGSDRLRGGSGDDVFVFQKGCGEDHVLDFGKGDRIDVQDFGFASAADVRTHLHEIAPGAFLLDFGGDGRVIFNYVNGRLPLDDAAIIF